MDLSSSLHHFPFIHSIGVYVLTFKIAEIIMCRVILLFHVGHFAYCKHLSTLLPRPFVQVNKANIHGQMQGHES